ncbi:MAG: hypothetical protein ACRYFU_24705 [Janthinobacterium lividum]
MITHVPLNTSQTIGRFAERHDPPVRAAIYGSVAGKIGRMRPDEEGSSMATICRPGWWLHSGTHVMTIEPLRTNDEEQGMDLL